MRWRGSAAALAVACIGLASCGGGGDDPAEGEESASTTVAPESTTTTLSITQEVEAAFLAFDTMLERLAQAPNPDDPEIVRRASGETFAGVQQSQTTLSTTGHLLETYWTEWTLRQVEGVWYVDSGDAIDMQQGEQSCE